MGRFSAPAYKYDLHLHSCLSPCGDNEMTPATLVGMAKALGLDFIALTDHNSSLNCPAALEAGRFYQIPVLPGMELCTAEEVHVVCLFPTLEAALAFGEEVYAALPPIQNDPAIFGDQLVMDTEDQVVGRVDKLLINACSIPLSQVPQRVAAGGGVCWPAHLDKGANSLVSNLGIMSGDMGFSIGEFARIERAGQMIADGLVPADIKAITNSDAHYLKDIKDPPQGEYLPGEIRSLLETACG
ncbi:PHP domain-containing protein [Bittarella massiliensis (ex Durand et al. 2017)]|uniref:PHP domain-containing protein n=1 Tax=Bittarella massiliensis (ex Durand et al. 2017) TaxID=1720313 RepID=A0AAW5KEG6_9FIRM|nr:PHP domain-containing protein [Bittarella massiliensis (ex Durand et al. 2017)]MBC2870859.1 PHP domain-containing protein [Bittarella massiliensis (ex Durand et al. 2017)]MCQ4948650.1 PHP domain-containing protein [Bittarella massiliensis (ex Durand et al. 2017)]